MENTLFEKVLDPAISNVPLVIARKPVLVEPSTVNKPKPGVKVSTEALEEPLLMLTPPTPPAAVRL